MSLIGQIYIVPFFTINFIFLIKMTIHLLDSPEIKSLMRRLVLLIKAIRDNIEAAMSSPGHEKRMRYLNIMMDFEVLGLSLCGIIMGCMMIIFAVMRWKNATDVPLVSHASMAVLVSTLFAAVIFNLGMYEKAEYKIKHGKEWRNSN